MTPQSLHAWRDGEKIPQSGVMDIQRVLYAHTTCISSLLLSPDEWMEKREHVVGSQTEIKLNK